MRRLLFLVLVAACGDDQPAATDDGPAPSDAPLADAPPDSAACGTRGGERGLQSREVTIDGLRRTYLVYLPPGGTGSEPMPLVYVHHGYTMSGASMVEITEYTALAESEHIALAFPDGQGGPNSNGAPWNVGRDLCPSNFGAPPVATGDDFALLDAMAADISEDQCLDRDHVFITGFSMGGYFTHHALCHRPDLRAGAPHSGGTHPLDECDAGPKPIIIFHGASDPLIPAGCADPAATPVAGVTPSAIAWAEHNGCATTTTQIPVENGTCFRFDGCPASGQVELCTFPGMGHCWAGGAASAGVYSCPTYAKATQLEWDFYKTYAW